MARPPAADPEPVRGEKPPSSRALRAALLAEVSGALRRSAPGFGRGAGAAGILVGFSGGLDSTALLRLVTECARRTPNPPDLPSHPPSSDSRVIAVHLDHALRADSAKQARFAARAAASLGVPFLAARREIAARARRERRSLEEAARLGRLDFFGEVARERRLSLVALGHTLTDQAETLLLRLVRGAGGLGLGAMPPARDDARGFRIVRPLLGVSRARIAALADAEGWRCYEDPLNDDPAFARNRIRRAVLPLLRDALNPQIEEALGRAAEVLREDEAFLAEASARRFAETAAVRGRVSPAEVRIPAAALRDAPPALARRLVRQALRTVRGHLRRIGLVHIEAALGVARAGRGGASLDLPGARVRLERGVLTLAVVESPPARERGAGRAVAAGLAEPEADAGVLSPGVRRPAYNSRQLDR